jgi:hypothetical protein
MCKSNRRPPGRGPPNADPVASSESHTNLLRFASRPTHRMRFDLMDPANSLQSHSGSDPLGFSKSIPLEPRASFRTSSAKAYW